MPVLTIGIVRDCFYLIFFNSLNVNLNLSIIAFHREKRWDLLQVKLTSKQPPFPQ